MMREWALLILSLLPFSALAGEYEGYQSPHSDSKVIDWSNAALLEFEREKLSNHLTAYVVNEVLPTKSETRLLWTSRLLGLALTLHPQNPRARFTDQHLVEGRAPKPIPSEMEASVLARLLFNRSLQLQVAKTSSQSNDEIARYFTAIAAQIDPYYEDAVYAHERDRFAGKVPAWALVSGEKPKSFHKAAKKP